MAPDLVAHLLQDERVSPAAARDCVDAASDLYRSYVAGRGLPEYDTAFFMLWDELAHGAREDLKASMVSALRRILELDDAACRIAALHGLGHLRAFADAARAIDEFIAEHAQTLSPEHLDYANRCRISTM